MGSIIFPDTLPEPVSAAAYVAEFFIAAVGALALHRLLTSLMTGRQHFPKWWLWVVLAGLVTGLFQVFHLLATTPRASAGLLAFGIFFGGVVTLVAGLARCHRVGWRIVLLVLGGGFLAAAGLALDGGPGGRNMDPGIPVGFRAIAGIGAAAYLASTLYALKLRSGRTVQFPALLVYCLGMAGAGAALVVADWFPVAHAASLLFRLASAGGLLVIVLGIAQTRAGPVGRRFAEELAWSGVRQLSSPVVADPVILAIDDDPDVLDLMRATFQDVALLATSRTRAEALHQIPQLQPDLVILDLNLADGRAHDLVDSHFGGGIDGPELLIYSVERFPAASLPGRAKSFVKSEVSIEQLRGAVRTLLAGVRRCGHRRPSGRLPDALALFPSSRINQSRAHVRR